MGAIRDGEVVWAEGLGWADREARIAATPTTVYPVASVSKSITATGALALVAAGRLRLDQPVAEALGEGLLPGPVAGMEIAHLLAHTAGIPHTWHYEFADRPETLTSRQALLREHAFTAAPPGRRYLYTNLGYGALAEVVERAGGEPFQRVMERALFAPLGMRHTTIEAWVGEAGAVRGYHGDGRAISQRFRLAPDGGAGFFSNLADLLRYAQFHLGQKTAAVSAGSLPADGFYHHGWGVVRMGAAHALISDGAALGGTAAVVLVPEEATAVVALCNATGGPTAEAAVATLSALLPGFSERFGEAVGQIEAQIAQPGPMPKGRFAGHLQAGGKRTALQVDFSDPEKPAIQLEGLTASLQGLAWEHGALTATVSAEPPLPTLNRGEALSLALWQEGENITGVAQEVVNAGEASRGVPYLVRLAPER
jgi:CubicO group peptidase (beta-lactamase class C family)